MIIHDSILRERNQVKSSGDAELEGFFFVCRWHGVNPIIIWVYGVDVQKVALSRWSRAIAAGHFNLREANESYVRRLFSFLFQLQTSANQSKWF